MHNILAFLRLHKRVFFSASSSFNFKITIVIKCKRVSNEVYQIVKKIYKTDVDSYSVLQNYGTGEEKNI